MDGVDAAAEMSLKLCCCEDVPIDFDSVAHDHGDGVLETKGAGVAELDIDVLLAGGKDVDGDNETSRSVKRTQMVTATLF